MLDVEYVEQTTVGGFERRLVGAAVRGSAEGIEVRVTVGAAVRKVVGKLDLTAVGANDGPLGIKVGTKVAIVVGTPDLIALGAEVGDPFLSDIMPLTVS